jgi:hypothetical protein
MGDVALTNVAALDGRGTGASLGGDAGHCAMGLTSAGESLAPTPRPGHQTRPVASVDWRDPALSWIAKLDRAQTHIDRLAELTTEFFAESPYTIDYEPAGDEVTHLRIVHAKPIPVAVSTIVGDAIHNMRSALDALAYELARISQGGVLTQDQESWVEFPIRQSEEGYSDFFNARRAGLFDEKAEEALRSVVPGHRFSPEAVIAGELITTFRDEVIRDNLWQLHRLSIIDKHRRLSVVALWPDDVWWLNRDGTEPPGWLWGRPPFETGAILGSFVGGQLPDRADLTATLEMRIFEPEVWVSPMPLVPTLQSLSGYIRSTVLSRVWHFY